MAKQEKEEDGGRSRYAGRNFYEVLGVRSDALLRDIQRAYRILALKVHPDRNGNSLESTRDFQELSRIMEILGDQEKRAAYDADGDDENLSSGTGDARTVFRKVTRADIETYSATYFGGDEEKQDVLDAYKRFEGDFEKMLEWIPLSSPDRLPIYEQIISKAKEKHPKWSERKEAAKAYIDSYANEEKEAEELLKKAVAKYTKFLPPPNARLLAPLLRSKRRQDDNEKDADDDDADDDRHEETQLGGLAAGMRAREAARQQAMVKSMEMRFGSGKRRRRLPTEEEFQQIQCRLIKQRKQK